MARPPRPRLSAALGLLLAATAAPLGAAPRASESLGALPDLPRALVPARALPANPYEAVAALSAGTRFDFTTTDGERVPACFIGFSAATGLIRFADGRGRTVEEPYEAFLSTVKDGSLSFAAGKDAPYEAAVPARYHARFDAILAAVRRQGVDVVWDSADDRDWRGLHAREREAGTDLPAYFAPTATDEFGNRRPILFVRPDAALGDLLREAGIASSWSKGALGSGTLADTLDAVTYSRAGVPSSREASGLALRYRIALRDVAGAWDASYDAARRGDFAPRRRAQDLALETAARLEEELSALPTEDPHRAALAEVQARLEAWVFSLPARRERPGFLLAPRAPEPRGPGVSASAASWKWYADRFARTARGNVERLRRVYRDAKRAGDPHIRFLEELGYRFEPEVVIPPLEQVFRLYNERVDRLIAAGTVRRGEALRPARAFKTPEGAFLFLQYGEEIPRGAVPYEGLLPEQEFAGLIASGFFVLGENLNNVTMGDHSALEHDLGHLSGFLEDPRYMAAIRRAYARVHRRGLALRDARGGFTPLRNRLYHLVEFLSVVPRADRPALLRLLELPARLERAPLLTVAAVDAHLASATPAERERLSAAVSRAYPRLVRHLGGGARDIVVREVTGRDAGASAYAGHDESVDGIRHAAFRVPTWRDETKEEASKRRRELARIVVALLESSRLDAARLVDEASRPEVAKDSSLYRWLCLTGLHEGDKVSESVCH